MSYFTNKTVFAALIVIILAFETTEAFYRPMPGLVENTLNQILKKQLERRFGPIPISLRSTKATTPTPAPTPTTSTTSAPSRKFGSGDIEKFEANLWQQYDEKCLLKKCFGPTTIPTLKNNLCHFGVDGILTLLKKKEKFFFQTGCI